MKNLHITSLMLCLVAMLFVSCEGDKPSPNPNDSDYSQIKPGDAMKNKDFNDWTKNWIGKGSSFLSQNDLIQYFDMPFEDLTGIVNEYRKLSSPPKNARFYLGLEPITVDSNAIHLMVVGVTDSGINLLDNSKGQYAYDLSIPCPPICKPKQ